MIQGGDALRRRLRSTPVEEGTLLFSQNEALPSGWESWVGVFVLGDCPPLDAEGWAREEFGVVVMGDQGFRLVKLMQLPSGRSLLVGRRRELAGLVEDEVNRRAGVTWLKAAAGFGKSTLLQAWTDGGREQVGEGERFFLSFTPKGGRVFHDWAVMAGLGEEESQTRDEGGLERLGERVAARFLEREMVILILDDCHWMTREDEIILRLVWQKARLKMRLVMASRDMEMPRHMEEFHPTLVELKAFSLGQIAELIQRVHGDSGEEELRAAAAQLFRVTAGHPLLTQEVLRSQDFPRNMSQLEAQAEQHHGVVELTRVYEADPHLIGWVQQRFLGMLAQLDEPFTEELANELAGSLRVARPEGDPFSDHFFTRIPGGRMQFRHALLRAACAEWFGLEIDSAARFAEVLRRTGEPGMAARFYRRAGQTEKETEALLLALEASYEKGEVMAAARRATTLFEGGNEVPGAEFHHYLKGGTSLFLTGQRAIAANIVQRGLSFHADYRYVPGWVHSTKGFWAALFFWKKRRETLHEGRHSETSQVISALRLVAEAQWLQQDMKGCVAAIAQAVQLAKMLPDAETVPRVTASASAVLLYAPVLPKAAFRRLKNRILSESQKTPASVRSEVCMIFGINAMGQKEWRKAVLYFRRGRREAERGGSVTALIRVACHECMVHYTEGNLEKALESCREVREQAQSIDYDHLEDTMRLLESFIIGDFKTPEQTLRNFLEVDQAARDIHPFESATLAGALGYLCGHQGKQALCKLEEALEKHRNDALSSYAAARHLVWALDAVLVGLVKEELPETMLKRVLKLVRSHGWIFPASRLTSRCCRAVVALYRGSEERAEVEIRFLLGRAEREHQGWLRHWLHGHLKARGRWEGEVPRGVYWRCTEVARAYGVLKCRET